MSAATALPPALQFGWHDWLQLFLHFAALSLLQVGGAITIAADLHRRFVVEHGWLADAQFANSIALAQAAPGPNVLFIGLVGWHVGLNAGGSGWAALGLVLALLGTLLPSSTLTLLATRWAHRHREARGVRAFKQGMAPLVVGMMLAAAVVLERAFGDIASNWRLWGLSAACAVLMWRTKLHLLWMLGAGAVLGALGWV